MNGVLNDRIMSSCTFTKIVKFVALNNLLDNKLSYCAEEILNYLSRFYQKYKHWWENKAIKLDRSSYVCLILGIPYGKPEVNRF